MNYLSSSFGDEENWNKNLLKGLKVEISLKFEILNLLKLTRRLKERRS